MYRIDYAYNTVYKYDEEQKAFLFYAKIDMLTKNELAQCEANQE
jgi:hypothetical protein